MNLSVKQRDHTGYLGKRDRRGETAASVGVLIGGLEEKLYRTLLNAGLRDQDTLKAIDKRVDHAAGRLGGDALRVGLDRIAAAELGQRALRRTELNAVEQDLRHGIKLFLDSCVFAGRSHDAVRLVGQQDHVDQTAGSRSEKGGQAVEYLTNIGRGRV